MNNNYKELQGIYRWLLDRWNSGKGGAWTIRNIERCGTAINRVIKITEPQT